MTKRFCDRCGREETAGRTVMVRTVKLTIGSYSPYVWDLCDDCAKALQNFGDTKVTPTGAIVQ